MPRKVTIFIPTDAEVLAIIRNAHSEALAADEGHGWISRCIQTDGVTYDLERFSGKFSLTAGERSKWQAAIRRLEADGFVVRYGNRIKPVEVGREGDASPTVPNEQPATTSQEGPAHA